MVQWCVNSRGICTIQRVISITASSATANNIQIGTRAESANVNGS